MPIQQVNFDYTPTSLHMHIVDFFGTNHDIEEFGITKQIYDNLFEYVDLTNENLKESLIRVMLYGLYHVCSNDQFNIFKDETLHEYLSSCRDKLARFGIYAPPIHDSGNIITYMMQLSLESLDTIGI